MITPYSAASAADAVRQTTGNVLGPPLGLGPQPPSYFRSYDQIQIAMYDLQRDYPNLVRVEDLGPSYQTTQGLATRDLLALRLTNQATSGAQPKPRTTWFGGVHAREIANPELLLKWAADTLAAYGKDPQATAALDFHEIDIVPVVNPDGHVRVEQGYHIIGGVGTMQRKTMHGANGVDPNRNFDYNWGSRGSSPIPLAPDYRGTGPASEPEVQAVQRFVLANRPSVFIDWHSHADLDLYPWGDTKQPAPDDAGLSAIARKFAGFNGYKAEPGIKLYPTSGTSSDWAYAKAGAAGFTVETGHHFHQHDDEFAETYRLNKPVLDYSVAIDDAPYERGLGPDTGAVTVRRGGDGRSVTVEATATAAPGAGKHAVASAITAAELVTDPAAPDGSGLPLAPADGRFDSSNEQLRGVVDAAAAAGQLVFVRARDAAGHWGAATPQWLRPAAG